MTYYTVTDEQVDRLAYLLFIEGYDMDDRPTAAAVLDEWTGNWRNSDTKRAAHRERARRYLNAAAALPVDGRPVPCCAALPPGNGDACHLAPGHSGEAHRDYAGNEWPTTPTSIGETP